MRAMAAFLLLLALIQLAAWLAPAAPSSKGIPHYLPLHVLLETVSIIVSMMVFAVGWNSRSSNLSGNIVLLASVFFSIGLLDFLHTISYGGMPDFISPNDPQKHLNFWLSARVLTSAGLLAIALRPWQPLRAPYTRWLIFGTLLSAVVIFNWVVVFHQPVLPDTFIPGQGLTPFKKNTEYLVILIHLATAAVLWQKMRVQQPFNIVLIFGAVITLAMSEFYFTLYTTMTGSYNVLGHLYKVIAYVMIYRALVVETIEEPYDKLALAQQKLATSLQASSTGLWELDLNTRQMVFSPEWKAQLGYQPDELSDHFSTWESLLHPEDRAIALQRMQNFLNSDRQNYENEFRMCHRNGSIRWIMARGEKKLDAHGRPFLLVGSHIDITERKTAEQRIEQLANYDMLTGLPNRLLLESRVQQAIKQASSDHTTLALIFLDLDHFKNINDTLGHRIGDDLLVVVGKRLQAVVRPVDTVSRMGGDEFMLLLPGLSPSELANIAESLLVAIAQPYKTEHAELIVTPSLGIALYPKDGQDFDTLYRHADTAMYNAKQSGRNSYRFFTEIMQQETERASLIENALRYAIERNELYLHYQPQLSLNDNRIIGVEALLRWQHPEVGQVSPGEFIPIAEKSGQIHRIGEWVMRTAMQQLKQWMEDGLPPMTMAVNLSAVQFRHPDLHGLVAHLLDQAGLPAQYLELELTESVTMGNPERAITIMEKLHALGVRLSIDDFGTGYSSLNYLKRFNVYKLKIDQSFVRDITIDPNDKAIVSAITLMSRSLGFLTIAEGVETIEQLEFLKQMGCDEIQGYYFSPPLAPEALAALICGMSPS